MSRVTTVISDFGGVLTTPLFQSFAAFQDRSGIPLETLGQAMAAIAERDGANPLFELELGRMSEHDFLAGLGAELGRRLGRKVDMSGFAEQYFGHLDPNEELIEYLRALRFARGYRMALLTNNVREWEPRWRAMLPVDEIFEHVIDSGFVGARKPDPEIFQIALHRLGVRPEQALFIDDFEINVKGAREVGMRAVQFVTTEQAIAEIEAALA